MNKKTELSPAEKWERLTFADNFIFCHVLENNPDICKELLELLLNIRIERIELPVSERTLKIDFESRGIRFDVYVKDGNGRSFDIEIQTTHSTALAKRARYYQGLIDVDNLQAGAAYGTLKDSYVIFLCLGDAFGKGLPVYTFRYACEEEPSIKMNDGTTNIFFNAKKYDRMESGELKSFFRYLCGKDSDSSFTDRLSALVERTKRNAQWRHRFMTWEQEMKYQSEIRAKELAKDIAKDMAKDIAKDMAQDIAKDIANDMAKDIAENMAESIAEEKYIETIRKMLDKNIPAETVAECTGFSIERVLELQRHV